MRWVLSLWRLRRKPPAWRELPVLLLKAVIFGAITGPLCTVFFTAVFDPGSLRSAFRLPLLLVQAPVVGVVYSVFFYIACGLGNGHLRYRLEGYPPSIIWTIHVIYNAVACSLAIVGVASVLSLLPGPMKFRIPYLGRVALLDGIVGAILAMVIGAFIKLKLQVEQTQTALRERELLQSQLAEETARAQALALQSQINPHFFFNTLNTISALVEIDPSEAKRTIGCLADMFRYTLSCTQSSAVGLEQELQFVRDYLAIEQARFRRRLRIELPEGPLANIRVPGLVLQPLVENAVKHGIAPRLDGGVVSIHVDRIVDRTGQTTRVSVRNSANGHTDFSDANLFRPGHALDNVRARLRLFTGNPNPLVFRTNGEWVEFGFDLPTANFQMAAS
jgi:two-component system LytT family sensor kinase